ncbi:MAG: hypothetical protein HFI71_14005 [Lachnospiraceae bacterium]|jgi:hypothetical protein|nr:hypothetical protein [Lachnospiraceae bacterium]
MSESIMDHEFNVKFAKLSKQNQKHILAIQQALLYAQTMENENKESSNNGKKNYV